MSAWLPRRRKPPPVPEERVPFAKTAPHIRGRVYRRGKTWFMEVVNTNTGKVLASDNTNDRLKMLNQCHEAVAVARGTWTYHLRWKDTR